MRYFEVTRRDMSEATKVRVITNDYEPIDGIEKMRIIMEPAISDYTIVRKISNMLVYQDVPIRFTFLTILEQYDIMSEWLGCHEDKIYSITIFISTESINEPQNSCLFEFDNMDDFDVFVRAIKNNIEPWWINRIKINLTDNTHIILTD